MRELIILFIAIFLVACGDKSGQKPVTKSDQKSGKSEVDTEGSLLTFVEAETSGVTFRNTLDETPQVNRMTYEYFYNGGGVAAGDINGDDLPDLYFTGNRVSDRLYLNKGNFTFEDITESAGIYTGESWNTGVTMVDINNDGLLDIYVCRSGWYQDPQMRRNLLYINNGNGTFTEDAARYGLGDTGHSLQAAFFDADRDGDLDVYILNHPVQKPQATDLVNYKREVETGQYMTDRYYRRDGDRYVEASRESGFVNFGYRHGIAISDVNRDGWPDIYISADFDDADHLYINDGDGTFTDRIHQSFNHITMFSMGCDFGDVDNDGWMDLFVADMTPGEHVRSKQNMASMNPEKFYGMERAGFHNQYMANSLQINNGNGSFSDIANLSGVAYTDWSWATLFADIDLDGYNDLFVTNGIKRDVLNNDVRIKVSNRVQQGQQVQPMDILNLMPSSKLANYLYLSNGDYTFNVPENNTLARRPAQSNGAIYSDLDNDGDLDLITSNIDQPAHLIKNHAVDDGIGTFLKVKLKGPPQNNMGIGARIECAGPDLKLVRELYTTKGFYSGAEPVAHFGIPAGKDIESIKVIWPDGKVSDQPVSETGKTLEISYSEADATFTKPSYETYFSSVSADSKGLNYRHQENAFDDFQNEILLPHRQSTQGPLMATGDVNGDGHQDLYIGGANGYEGRLFLGGNSGRFKEKKQRSFSEDKVFEDAGATFFDLEGDGDLDLYVASGGYYMQPGNARLQDRMYINDGKGKFSAGENIVPTLLNSASVAVATDYDGDGDEDIFVGGRVIPGKYPFPANSVLLRNDNGKLVDATDQQFPDLTGLGMITSAQFFDMDGDGDRDAVLAGEWTDILFYTNDGGVFSKCETCGSGKEHLGWWFSLRAEDMDDDGDMDLIAGNVGENNKFHPSDKKQLLVYTHDFDGNGSIDIVLSKKSHNRYVPVRGRECSSEQMPMIKDKFPTYQAYAEASLEQIYGPETLDKAFKLEANQFSSLFFRNEGGGKFVPVRLPSRAQFAPARSIVIDDFNGDGMKDILLAGNHFGAEVETVRYDAGTGCLLIQDNVDGFVPLAPYESGLDLTGDVRDLVWNRESGTLIVSNNQGPVSVYRLNAQAGGSMQ